MDEWTSTIRLVSVVAIPIILLVIMVNLVTFFKRMWAEQDNNLTPARQEALRQIFSVFVLAAEQVFREKVGAGQDKKEWVISRIRTWAEGHNIRLTDEQIEAFIEAAVLTDINGPKGVKQQEAIAAATTARLAVADAAAVVAHSCEEGC